jgi:hypothetical protein
LVFELWLIVVDPCFITGKNAMQKGITYPMILAQKMVTHVPVLFHELFWNPFYTNFMEMKSVMDDFIGRIVTNLQLFCHFDSLPSVVENQHGDLSSVP